MAKTLILYESRYGTSQQTAEMIGCLFFMSKCRSIKEVPDDLSFYENMVFVFGMFGAETAKAYIANN